MTCRHLFGDSPHCVRCYERSDATDHTFTDVLALAGAMGSALSPPRGGPHRADRGTLPERRTTAAPPRSAPLRSERNSA